MLLSTDWLDEPDNQLQTNLLDTGNYRSAGIAAFHQNKYGVAAQYFSLALEHENDLLVRYFLGLSYYELGQTQQALEQWSMAESKPIARALTNRAMLANRLNDHLSAELHAEAALKLDPFLGEAYLELGRAHAVREDWDAALVNYETAVELITDKYVLSSLYRAMGTLYGQISDVNSAIHIYEKAVKLTPDSYFGYLQLADAYQSANRFEDAVTELEKAISLDPRNILAYLRVGDIYRDTNRLEQAVDWYERAKSVDPASGRADYAIGVLLLRNGRPHEAVIHLEHARDLGWQPYWMFFDLGNAYEQTGQLEAAIDTYAQVAEMDNVAEATIVSAWARMAQAYSASGDLKQAERAWLQVLALNPSYPAIPQEIKEKQQQP
jgi:tetratricopeptide (TPR) repeat protein